MKKLFPLLLLALCYNLSAQIVDIPDPIFKSALLASSSTDTIAKNLNGDWIAVDANGDGEIQVSEATNIAQLTLVFRLITDLTGISSFVNLTYLQCSNNLLTSLDISQNILLEEFWCINNALTSLDVSQNTLLETLSCSHNRLTSLDVSYNPALEVLDCASNDISSLDISQNLLLQQLDCGKNDITSLDVSQNPSLEVLECDRNQLTSLDVSQNPWLEVLECDQNQLTSLDVSQNPSLKILNCNYTQLTSLDVSHNPWLEVLECDRNQLTSLDVSQNPSLKIMNCNYNQLTSLDVSHNPLLDNLSCGGNELTSLDVSHNPLLEKLWCGLNLLTSLDVSQNTLLNDLWCSENPLTSLDVSQNTLLEVLFCYSTQLTSLDVSRNTLLEVLYCFSNQLTSLDVSQNPRLELFGCENNLITSLDVTQNPLLSSLSCKSNQLKSLDVSQNPSLEVISCNNNLINSLDVSHNPLLENLYCSSNQLTSLDVSHNPLLEYLYCNSNQLTSLDVSQNLLLEILWCWSNDFTSLDVSQNPLLQELNCGQNDISSLDVSHNPLLQELDCRQNDITSLDVSHNPLLEKLNCANNWLTYINLKNSQSLDLRFFLIDGNPNLQYICCHERNLTLVQYAVDDAGYGSTCQVSTFCNFTPDGDYKTIYGQSILDLNGNACDSNDANYPYVKILVDSDQYSGYFYSNASGAYQIFLDSANYMLIPKLENPDYFNVSPDTAFVDFAQDSSPVELNFCISPNGVHHDLEVSIIPMGTPARPGFDADYKVMYRNKGTEIEDASIQFSYDDGVLDFLSSTLDPSAQASGALTFELGQINPLEEGDFVLTFNLNSPMESPPLNGGDLLTFVAHIQGQFTDATPMDNTFTLIDEVVNSYDPNDKTCLEGPILNPEMIGDYVHYKIRFENTGTFYAQNIIVRDSINPSMFDIATLEIIDASHDVATSIKGNNVEFIFENIALPFDDANNDGYIVFKIKTKNTLALKDEIKNSADIYFDFNFPIVTEDATSIYDYVGTNNIPADLKEILVYPNPAIDRISFDTDLTIERIEIYDLLGRLVMLVDTESNSIDVGALVAGKYQVLIFTKDELMRAGFVRE